MAAATLLDLPVEVQWQIADELPLPSYLTLALHVCRALRTRLTSPGASNWQRAIASRFSLVAWKQAADEWRTRLGGTRPECAAVEIARPSAKSTTSIWDTDGSDTPKPALAIDASMARQRSIYRNRVLAVSTWRSTGNVTAYDPAESNEGKMDVDLLIACLELLHGHGADTFLPPLTGTTAPASSLRTLSLLSQKGIGLARLLALLHSNTSSLANVQTVLITSAESTLWYDYEPPQSLVACPRSSQDGVDPREGTAPTTCTETQAIVIPSVKARRGYGLQVGFKCLCYGSRRREQHTRLRDGSSNEEEHARPDDDAPSIAFHVILHDWYDADEAMGTEDMLAHSRIECNWCGHDIVF